MELYYLLGILILPGIIYASIVQGRVSKAFNTYKTVKAVSGLTTAEACKRILECAGVTGVKIVATKGHLTDHYNPKTKTVNLSEEVYNSTSISALGVAAHEVGHAIQHAQGYKPLKVRNALVKVNNICSNLFWVVIIASFFLTIFASVFYSLIFIGVAFILYLLSFIVSVSTYPVEKDASKRALDLLVQNNILDTTEVRGAEVVLKAAAQTYLAGIIVSVLYLARFILAVFLIGNSD